MDHALPDHVVGKFEDDGRDIAPGEEVFPVEKGFGSERAVLEQGGPEDAQRRAVAGEQIGREADEYRHIGRRAHHLAGVAGGDQLALVALERRCAGRPAHFERLHVRVAVAVAVHHRSAGDLESQFFLCVAVEIEAKGVKSFLAQ